MESKASYIVTPVGVFNAPLNPAFETELKKCNSNEDLFALVEPNGFMDPDAFNEVCARKLQLDYERWRKQKLKDKKSV